MRRSGRAFLVVLTAAALTLAACGDDSTETATAGSTNSPTQERSGAADDLEADSSDDDSDTLEFDPFADGNLGRFDLGDGLTFIATSSGCGAGGETEYDLEDGETPDSVVLVLAPQGADSFQVTLFIHGDLVGEGVATVDGNFDGATFADGRFDDGEAFSFELLTGLCDGEPTATDEGDDFDLPEHGGADDDQGIESASFGFVDFEGVLYEALERSCRTTAPEPDYPHSSTIARFEIFATDGTSSFVLEMATETGEEYFLSFYRFGESEPEFTAYAQVDMASEDQPGYLIGSGEFDDGGELGFNLDFSGPDC